MATQATGARGLGPVLVVDDDPQTRQALDQLLRHYGYLTLTAGSVAEALSLLSHNPRFILLDLMLPDGDGANVLKAVRDRNLKAYVAVITGVIDPEHMARVRRLGPDAVLQKPVDFVQILERLERVP